MQKTLAILTFSVVLAVATGLAPAFAAPGCGQLTRQYSSEIEPIVTRFIDMTDSGKQCDFGKKNRKTVRDFSRSFDKACKGNLTGKSRTAKEDLATFALTLRSICGP